MKIVMNKKLFLIATVFLLNFASLLQAPPVGSKPTFSRVYGDRFTGQESFDPAIGLYGDLDLSFGTDADGSVDLSSQFSGSQAVAVKTLTDGSVLVALDNGVDTKIVKYTAVGTVHSSGFGVSGIVTLTGYTNTRSMMIDSRGKIYVVGGNDSSGTSGWIIQISQDGLTTTVFNAPVMEFVGAIAEQSSGRIIAVGRNASYAEIVGFTLDGNVDPSFGPYSTGLIVMNGLPTYSPNTSSGIYSMFVNYDDSIFIVYQSGSNTNVTKYLVNGILDDSFGTHGTITASYLASATANQIRMVIDNDGNIVIAAQVGTSIKLTAYSITGASASPAFTNVTISASSDTLNLSDLVATTDGNIQVISYNSTDKNMRIDSITNRGAFDSVFNNGTGSIEFNIDSPDTSSVTSRAAISSTGKIYVAGWQVNSSVTTPYLSRLFGKIVPATNKFLAQVAQQPTTDEQGDIDPSFGSVMSTTPGVIELFDGLYGASLQQQANAVIELASRKFLVGLSGYTNSSATSNMMLSRLNANGTIDTTFGTSGFSNLPLNSLTGMVITSLLETADNSILVSGYSDTGAVVRKISSLGVEEEFVSDVTALKTLGVAIQGTQRILVFNQVDATHGEIVAYLPGLTGLDTTFNVTGNVPGKISRADFDLGMMGPLYGYTIDAQNNIYIAYKNACTHRVDVTKIYADGSGVILDFGIIFDVFGDTITNVQDVRLALDNEGELIIAAVLACSHTNYTVKRLFAADGSFDTTFDSTVVPLGATAILNNLTILDDNTIILTGACDGSDYAMITARVTTSSGVGVVDTTFNKEGATPGILPLQIGHKVSSYYNRAATALAIQSSTGNMILTGYEQQTSTFSIPLVMRIFGKPNTTLLAQYPVVGTTDVAGTLDLTFNIDNDGNGTGSIDLTSLVSSGAATTVYAYRPGSAHQGYLLLGIDTGTSVKIVRIRESNHSLDTSFGMCSSGIRTLSGKTGLNHVSLDANGKILVAGTQSGLGWATRLTENGAVDVAFQSLASITAINDMAQQESGRYIVVGSDSNNKGLVAAFKDKLEGVDTALQLDPTFNPLAVTTIATAGLYEISTTATLPSVEVGDDDTICVAYSDTVSTHVNLVKIQANGAAVVPTFNNGLAVNTGITPANSSSIRVAVDSNDSIVVASASGANEVDGYVDITINVQAAQQAANYTGSLTNSIIVPDSALTTSTYFNVALTGNNGDDAQIATVYITGTHSNATAVINSISYTGDLVDNGSTILVTSHVEASGNLTIYYTLDINANSSIIQDYTGSYSEHIDFPCGTTSVSQSGIVIAIYSSGNPNETATIGLTIHSNGTTSIDTLTFSGSLINNSSYITTDSHSNAYYTVLGDNCVDVIRYTSTGVIDTTFNGGSLKSITGLGTSGVTLGNMIIDTNNKILIFGSNSSDSPNGYFYATRLTHLGALDTTWNNVPTGGDVQGILTFEGGNGLYASSIYINGTIYAAGVGYSNNPLLFKIFGDDYVGQLEQQPFEVAAGLLDTTLDTLTPGTGAWSLSGQFIDVNSSGYAGKALHIYADGSILMAACNNIWTSLFKLKADLTLDESFGVSGYGRLAPVNIRDMFVADGSRDDGSIYLTGDDTNGNMQSVKISASGALQNLGYVASSNNYAAYYAFNNTTPGMVYGSAIRKTSNDRILVAGYDGTNGVVAGYDINGNIDPSFGQGSGKYLVAGPILAMTIDALDRIYIAYLAEGQIVLERLDAYGTVVDADFSSLTISANSTFAGKQARLAIDNTNGQIVMAFQDGTGHGNVLRVERFNLVDGSAAGALDSQVTIMCKTLQLADLLIDDLQNIYVAATNSTDNKVVVARIKSNCAEHISLDTVNYAVNGGTPGIANLSAGINMAEVGAAALHPDRRVYLLGDVVYGQLSLARVFGDAYVDELDQATFEAAVGVIDLTLDANAGSPDGGIVITSLYTDTNLAGYTARVAFTNNDGSVYVALDNGANWAIIKLSGDMQPLALGGVADTNVLISSDIPLSISSIGGFTVAENGDLLITAISEDAHVVYRYVLSEGVFTPQLYNSDITLTSVTDIGEQESARIIVSGYQPYDSYHIYGGGTVLAYKHDGSSLDTTFGAYGFDGFYSIGIDTPIDDMVIDAYDNIYVVYRDTNVKIQKIRANGAGLDHVFGSGATVDTGFTSTQPAHIGINNDGNILVGGTNDSGVQTALFNGSAGTIIGTIQTITSAHHPILTDLSATGTKFVGSVYQSTGCSKQMITFRLLGSNGLVDNTFGLLGISSNDPESATAMYGIAGQYDGKIIMVGCNASDPVLMRVYGTSYETEDAQYPCAVQAGILDATLFPTSGALDLDTLFSAIPGGLEGYTGARIYTYANNDMLFLFVHPTSYILVRTHKDLSLDASFNTSYGPGYIKYDYVTGVDASSSLYVDSLGNIFVAGGSTTSFVRAYDHNGNWLSSWTVPTMNLSAGAFALAGQSSSRLILAGQNTNGTLYAYGLDGNLDATFGNGVAGQFDTGVASVIEAISVDSDDNIIMVYASAGSTVLNRVYSDGSALDGTLPGSGTAIANVSGNGLKLVQDINDHIIVAAATTSGFKLARYSANDGSDSGSQIHVASGGSSTSHLTDLYTTTDGKVVMIGYETSTNNQVVIRLTSGFALDSTFGSNGVFSQQIGSMLTANAGAYYNDDRTLLLGDNGSEPFMGRVFGDYYSPEVVQAPALGVPGTIDTGFATSGSFNFASLDTGEFETMQAKVILTARNGGNYIAFDNGMLASQLIRLSSNDTLDTTYNSTGIAATAPQGVNFIMMDGLGRIILAGDSGSLEHGGWIQRYTTNGTADTTFNEDGTIIDGAMNSIDAVVEQTLARIVVAGANKSGKAALRAYTNLGALDTTFNSLGDIPGEYDFGSNVDEIYSLVADQYDRLIVAYLNNVTGNVEIARFTSNGELDITFGTNNSGIITNTTVSYYPLDYNFDIHTSLGGSDYASGSGTIGSSYVQTYVDSDMSRPAYPLVLTATPATINIDGITTSVYLADGLTIYVAERNESGNNTDVVVNAPADPNGTVFGFLTVTGTPSAVTVAALSGVNSDASSVRLVLDAAGNIIVTAVYSDGTGVEVAAFDNGTASSGNGQPMSNYNPGTFVSGLTNAVVTSMVATEDGNVLIGGYESCNHDMWVARVTNTGILDASNFNPAAIGGIAGLMEFKISTCFRNARVLNAMAIRHDGRISMVGYEVHSGTDTSFLARAYNDPYSTQIAECQDSLIIGTNDRTFGLTGNNGVDFFALSSTENDTNNQDQVARAVALQGNNRVVVALDGQDRSDTSSRVFLNKFNIDGILDTQFNSTGQLEVPHLYENEYVQDMVSFATPSGVNKAILAGYAYNAILDVTTSWLMQYNLDTASVDTSFGGIDHDAAGTVSGDIQQLNVVTRQASQRIIASGLNYDNTGTILGYSSYGKLDNSFGTQGYYFTNATTGIYTHAIDSQDRVVFAYNDGTGAVIIARLLADGSALDTTFFNVGSRATEIVSIVTSPHDQICVAVDANDDIYVAAANAAGSQYEIHHYSESGGRTAAVAYGNAALAGTTSLTIARLLVDTSGKVTIIGADHSGNDNYVIVKLDSGLNLDTSAFNGLGYLKYKINSEYATRQTTDGMISADGRIYVVGTESNLDV